MDSRKNGRDAGEGPAGMSWKKAGVVCLVLGVLFLLLGGMNARDMAAGDMYSVILGFIPVQYILLPFGALALGAGICLLVKNQG